MSATGNSTISVQLNQTLPSGAARPDDATISASVTSKDAWTAGDGSAVRTIDLVAFRQDTIASGSPSTPVTHDLEAISDLAGVAVDFAHARLIFSHVDSGPDNVVVIMGNSGGDAFEDAFMNGTTPAVEIPDEGSFFLDKPQGSAGWSVTTNQTDLKFDAGTTAESTVLQTMYAGND